MNYEDEDKRPRRMHEEAVGDLVSELMSLAPKLTDAEWAARDAEIARERADAEHAKNARAMERRAGDLTKPYGAGGLGWPDLAVSEAQRADFGPFILRVQAWSRTGILVLAGPKGCGKTVAAARWALAQPIGKFPLFVRAATFATSSRYGEEHRRFVDSPDLVLDDLGAEYVDAKGSFLTDLDELVDTFYGAKRRRLLITTNIRVDDFARRYGERITDRLRERGQWFESGGESLRKQPETGDR
jgi:DNA replication protein DnaC